jgi:hypothetical protein
MIHACSYRFSRVAAVLCALAFAGTSGAQSGGAQSGGVQSNAAPSGPKVAIVGASVSAGFKDGPATGGSPDNDTVPLSKIVKAWLADADGTVTSRAELMMFVNPLELGRTQIEKAKKDRPDLLVAFDFLFWFGYGHVGADEAKERLQRLETGLALLDPFDCPIVVGNLPDMTGAARRMISEQQIPKPAVLKALNERITAWAKDKPHVRLFDLGGLVHRMKEQGVELPVGDGTVLAPKGSMLQGDRLHANRLGMAWLGVLLQAEVHAVVPKDSALAKAKLSFEQFADAAGALADLEELQAAGKAPAGAVPAGSGR